MAYQLVKGVYRVKCSHQNCPFDYQFRISQKIMGVTEDDVATEAEKFARDMALMKHDAIYGTKHTLTRPEIRKVGGTFEELGARPSHLKPQPQAVVARSFAKGELILQKGENATAICEIVKGSAYPERDHSFKYRPGDCFGSAALLSDKNRTADILAAEDGTEVAFYNLLELRKSDARKAAELYNRAMEDIFDVVENLEHLVNRLEKKLEKEEIVNSNLRERAKALEKELLHPE